MRALLSVGLAAGLAATFFACAEGTSGYIDDGAEGAADAGRPLFAPPDAAPSDEDAATGTKKDSGTTPKDSGTTPKDSGTTPPPTGANDCTGATSSQLGDTYENACDNYYFNSGGAGEPCAPGGNDCAALNTSSLTFCCYKPLPTSGYCYDDYGGQAQCLPK
ncbi:MAG: hypothetical protein JWP97_2931 [Labilithrix sp.]|nr:hypothetical protein [Labilithrix sp.]